MLLRKKELLLIAPGLVLALSFQLGCATKKYVKQQTDPVSGRVDELSEVSKRNETAIKDVDSRAQAGIQTVQTRLTRWTRKPSRRLKRERKLNRWPRKLRHRL